MWQSSSMWRLARISASTSPPARKPTGSPLRRARMPCLIRSWRRCGAWIRHLNNNDVFASRCHLMLRRGHADHSAHPARLETPAASVWSGRMTATVATPRVPPTGWNRRAEETLMRMRYAALAATFVLVAALTATILLTSNAAPQPTSTVQQTAARLTPRCARHSGHAAPAGPLRDPDRRHLHPRRLPRHARRLRPGAGHPRQHAPPLRTRTAATRSSAVSR